MRRFLASSLLFLTIALGGCAGGDIPTGDSGADTAAASDEARDTSGSDDTGDTDDTDTSGISDTADTSDTDTSDTSETGDTSDTQPDGPSAPIVVYAVRHAEKESEGSDPGLTEEGQARAEALAVLMTDVPLDAIYATTYRRTQETVQPTADDQGIEPITDIDPEEALAAHILDTHAGDIVLHAGHSWTLEDFMEALGLDDPPSVNDYGDLWILTVATDGEVTIEYSRYGD